MRKNSMPHKELIPVSDLSTSTDYLLPADLLYSNSNMIVSFSACAGSVILCRSNRLNLMI